MADFSYRSLAEKHLRGDNVCIKPFEGRAVKSLAAAEAKQINDCKNSNDERNQGDLLRFFQAIDFYTSIIWEGNAAIGVKRSVNELKISEGDLKKVDSNDNGILDDEDIEVLYTRLANAASDLAKKGIGLSYPVRWNKKLVPQARDYLLKHAPELYKKAFPKG